MAYDGRRRSVVGFSCLLGTVQLTLSVACLVKCTCMGHITGDPRTEQLSRKGNFESPQLMLTLTIRAPLLGTKGFLSSIPPVKQLPVNVVECYFCSDVVPVIRCPRIGATLNFEICQPRPSGQRGRRPKNRTRPLGQRGRRPPRFPPEVSRAGPQAVHSSPFLQTRHVGRER